MSGTAQGRVEIRVSISYLPGGEGAEVVERRSSARLLTEDMRKLLERQNIDCSDINCMKWPIFGVSRHASCKLLMFRSDLMDLMAVDPNDWSDESSGNFFPSDGADFVIWFIVGSEEESTSTRFTRMVISDITPTMISEFGKDGYGEAAYIVHFRCDRWFVRDRRCLHRYEADPLNMPTMAWDPSCSTGGNPEATATTSALVEYFLKRNSGIEDVEERFYEEERDFYSASTVTSAGWTASGIATGLRSPRAYPTMSVVDQACQRTGVAIAYLPRFNVADVPTLGTRYNYIVTDVSKGSQRMVAFLNEYKDDVIAGSFMDLDDGTGPSSPTGFGAKVKIPNVIARLIRPQACRTMIRVPEPADGAAPNVFNQLLGGVAPVGSTNIPDSADPFALFPGNRLIHYNRTEAFGFPNYGVNPSVYINADKWARPSWFLKSQEVQNATSDENGIGTDVSSRWAFKYSAGVCDIWLRGWVLPSTETAWAGGSFAELRLQTDGNGFGFPTTRIHGDIDDPILGPVGDSEPHDFEGSGMVKTWRGEDGRMRVHVAQPFGIPCLIRLTGATRISDTEGVGEVIGEVDAWRYTAELVHKERIDTFIPGPLTDYFAGLEDFEIGTITAYNLMETRNTSTFSAPSYKIPLPQTGYDILPIGRDRDGAYHSVVVQAMLYMTDYSVSDTENLRVCAYFCVTNGIDGECPAPLTGQTLDGGTF